MVPVDAALLYVGGIYILVSCVPVDATLLYIGGSYIVVSCVPMVATLLYVGGSYIVVCCVLVDATLQRVVNDPIEHHNILAAHYLNKHPGLESVLKALARFRQLAMKSCRKPSLVFKEAPWDA